MSLKTSLKNALRNALGHHDANSLIVEIEKIIERQAAIDGPAGVVVSAAVEEVVEIQTAPPVAPIPPKAAPPAAPAVAPPVAPIPPKAANPIAVTPVVPAVSTVPTVATAAPASSA